MLHDRKAYDHNVVCTMLLLVINQTLKQNGQLQKLLYLLQNICLVYQKKNLSCKLWASSLGPLTA